MRSMRVVLLLAAMLPAFASAAGSGPAPKPAAELKALLAASDEAALERNPIRALLRGDMRYNDRFGDYVSDAYFAGERAAAEADLAALARIDRSRLDPDDRISYDVFRYDSAMNLRGFETALLKAKIERPIDQFFSFHLFVPQIVSGDGAAPFKTTKDYEDNLKRLDGYVVLLDRSIERMKQGLADGITNPRVVMEQVVGQFDALLPAKTEDSVFYGPILKFPDAVPDADRSRLKSEYGAFIRERLDPAQRRVRDFIRDVYLPKARTSVGLGQMPGGPALYRYLVEQNTTTTMTPAAIHALGLREVDRIRAEMTRVTNEVGFKGTLAEFFVAIRTDPKFRPASGDAMRDAFLDIDKRVTAVVGKDFSTLPRSPLEVRPVPAYKEKTDALGSYLQGTPDGSRPGIFYYNAYDLPSRSTVGFETLFLHEGIPGHHFQISLAQEKESLPAMQRFGGNTAYVEGWALYAESLGYELGFYADPYQNYGHLDDEMLRAMRLVVDTGIHAEGWTREQAIRYMLENSAIGRAEVTAEVERYIAVPGQALAYKIGQLTIRRLRTEAEQALGPKFDVRDFHAQVLMSGALPMQVLEKKIADWIARGGGS